MSIAELFILLFFNFVNNPPVRKHQFIICFNCGLLVVILSLLRLAAVLLPVHLQLSELKRFSSRRSKCSKNSNVYLLALFWFEPICASKCIVLYGYCRIDEAGKNEAVSGDCALSIANKMSICKLIIGHKIYQNLLSHRHIAQSLYTDIIMIVYLCRNMFGFCIL